MTALTKPPGPFAAAVDAIATKSRAMRLEHFTVERAKQLIEAQPPGLQRSVNMAYVRTYARLMEKGVWLDDLPDNVVVLSDVGELIDGQHRCRAAILANRSFGAWVSSGHPTDTIKLLGQANPRQVSATLRMTGTEDAVLTAAAAKLFFNYLCGESPFVPVVMTIEDIEEVYREVPHFGEWVKEGRRMYGARPFHSAAPTSALMVYLLGRTMMINAVVARRFWKQVETGADTTETTLLLRNMWMSFRGKRGKIEGKIWHHNTCARAWERFRNGTVGKTIIVPRDRLLEWR